MKSAFLLKEFPFLKSLIKMANQYIPMDKIVVFGSRARGDNSKISDFDLAFYFSVSFEKEWPRFTSEARENLPTLLEMDFVNVHSASPDLIKSIESEGITIYEKNSHKTS